MTDPSSQNPQSSEPSSYTPEEVKRIRRNVRQRTWREAQDEWIAAIIAFGTIGAILFWSFGGRKSNLNLLSQNSFFSSPDKTTDIDTDVDLDLDSQDFVANEGSANLNLAPLSADIEEEEVLSSEIDTSDSPTLKKPNNLFAAVPLIGATTKLLPKEKPELKVTPLEIPAKPELELKPPVIEPELEVVTPEVEPKVEIEAEPEVPVVSEPEVEVDPNAIAFANLPDNHWAYPFVSKLGTEKLLPNAQGFKPDEPINRAEMASLISSAFKDNATVEATKEFSDISPSNRIMTDINKAVSLGFMNGYSEGDFRPRQFIPRYQVLVALATGLGLEPSGNAATILQKFGDSSELPDWSLNQVAAATEAGLAINRPGFALSSLKPDEPATRAEVASMIHQALAKSGKLPAIESEYIVPKP